MAGILDFLQSPDAQLGIGLLAAGGPTTDPNRAGFGQRIAGAMQGMDAQRQQELKMKLLQSQVDENASQNLLRQSQIEADKRKQLILNQWLQGGSGGQAPAGTTSGPAVGGPQMSGPVTAPATGGFNDKFSPDALARLKLGTGVDMVDIAKLAQANWQQVGGNWVNTNDPNFKGGIQDQVIASPNGSIGILRGGASPTFGLVPGSQGALNTLEDTKNRSAGKFQFETVIDQDPASPTYMQKIQRSRAAMADSEGGGSAAPTAGTLGMRNNNPGNLRPPGASTGFQQFASPEEGIAALDRNLQSYGTKGINTIAGVINRWAPSNENDTNGYVASVSKRLGIPANQPIDLSNPYARHALTTAIMLHENGPSILTGGSGARPAAANVVELSPQQQADNEASKRFKVGVAESASGRVAASADAAQSAQTTIQNVQQIRSGLDKALVGPGAKWGVLGLQIGQSMGLAGKDSAETLSNTRSVIQGLARQELSAAGQMKGQGQITEGERGILRRAESGEIDNFTKPELQVLMGALEKTATYRIQTHDSMLNKVEGGATPTDLMRVQAPPAAPAAPVASMRFNPSTGKLEKVQ